MRSRERGAGLLVAVILIVTVAAFAVLVAASQTGGDIQGNDAHADSVQALYLAETGVERALKRFATGTACNALAEVINDTSGLQTTGARITVAAGLATDFAGAALPATQCRIPVTGTVLGSNVARTVHAIVDRNLLGAVTGGLPFNPAFNNPRTLGAPSSWTLTQPGVPAATQLGYANDGGHELEGATCSRSAYLIKDRTNNYTVRAQGLANVSFTVTGGSQTNVTFHYRLNSRGPNAGCAGGGATAGPADICAGAGGNPGTACFRTTDSLGTNSTATLNSAVTITQAVACPDGGAISAFATCPTGYQGGYPVKASVNIATGGAGTRTITAFRYMLRLQTGGRREMFLDHVEATNNTAIGAAHVRLWRDCSTAPDTVNCV